MGNPLFGINISGIIADKIGPGVLPATLVKRTNGTRTSGHLTAGTNPTEASYSCKGFIDTKQRRNREGTLVADGTETILLIGDTINGGSTAPEIGDQVTIEGVTYIIENLDRDPAAATYSLISRKI